jgi:hypothetical protein
MSALRALHSAISSQVHRRRFARIPAVLRATVSPMSPKRTPQTAAKREREQARRERRANKEAKKRAAAEARKDATSAQGPTAHAEVGSE